MNFKFLLIATGMLTAAYAYDPSEGKYSEEEARIPLLIHPDSLKDLDIDFMLRGNLYAQSSFEDTAALGGFGNSDNAPKRVGEERDFEEEGFFLKIDTSRKAAIEDKYNGYGFYIVNRTDSMVELNAADSRLYVFAEVYYKGKWQAIEYLPSSWCGNSYHRVFLRPNEYWAFEVPKFSGKKPVRLRYKLSLGNNTFLYSNEIMASINKGQLSNKQGHTPNGIMDPYND